MRQDVWTGVRACFGYGSICRPSQLLLETISSRWTPFLCAMIANHRRDIRQHLRMCLIWNRPVALSLDRGGPATFAASAWL